MHRIVQLTDCHLFADPERTLRDIDLLVITGDTAHDEDAATYEAIPSELKDWNGRVRIVPGNHDNRLALRDRFPQAGDPCEGRVTFYEKWDDWQVIGLDSQRPDELSGPLNDEQLAWLRNRLETAKQLDTLLFLHHPPISVQSPWLDRIGLQDAAELERLLRDHPQGRIVGCGHVHQEVIASFGGATAFTTPAVGPMFCPRTEQLAIDPAPPGYRVLELFPDGRWSTQVLYGLQSIGRFTP